MYLGNLCIPHQVNLSGFTQPPVELLGQHRMSLMKGDISEVIDLYPSASHFGNPPVDQGDIQDAGGVQQRM